MGREQPPGRVLFDPMESVNPRIVALYLPQFHRVAENDLWWGEGFTEWTNAKKGRKWFPWQHQPHEPSELGYYDLTDPSIRERQAELARQYAVEGFCYYHYWFGGKRLLERPFHEVLTARKPDFPFCLLLGQRILDRSLGWPGKTDPPGADIFRRRPSHPRGTSRQSAEGSSLRAGSMDARYSSSTGPPGFPTYPRRYRSGARPGPTRVWGTCSSPGSRQAPWKWTIPAPSASTPRSSSSQPWRDMGLPDNWIVRYVNRLFGRRIPAVHDYSSLVDRMLDRPDPAWAHDFPDSPRCGTIRVAGTEKGLVLKGATPELYGTLAFRLPGPGFASSVQGSSRVS